MTAAILILYTCASCSNEITDSNYNRVVKLHEKQRDYHFEKNAQDFVNLFSENFISVNKGEISIPEKEESLKRFSSYFESVQFEKWDDLRNPIIYFSEDSSMAFTVVNKEVVLSYNHENDTIIDTTQYAWVTIYAKNNNNEWKILCNASTTKPI